MIYRMAKMNGLLGNYFDAIYVISLDQRCDRRARLGQQMEELGLAKSHEITWIRAVSGEKCWAPGFFAAGAGAWGCLQSHLRVLQDAIMDGRERIMVIEDDATFHARSPEMLELFLRQVPGDWDQLFFGGEHAAPPELIKHRPFVLKGRCVHRTHAFAMRKEILPVIYQHIANYPDYMKGGQWHVDHQLGQGHQEELWKTYAPAWWIVGQKGGSSDISERKNPDYWWHPEIYAPQLPFVWLSADVNDKLKAWPDLLHPGNNLLPGTLQDEGLGKCVDSDEELAEWLTLIATEAIALGKLPAIQHPMIGLERISALWTSDILRSDEIDFVELANFPFVGPTKHLGDIKKILQGVARRS